MRVSEAERELFLSAVASIDPGAKVWLFGSRSDDTKKGGDIDLAILSNRIGRAELRRIRWAIVDCLGDQHIDLVVSEDGTDPFFRLAVETGVPLNA